MQDVCVCVHVLVCVCVCALFNWPGVAPGAGASHGGLPNVRKPKMFYFLVFYSFRLIIYLMISPVLQQF